MRNGLQGEATICICVHYICMKEEITFSLLLLQQSPVSFQDSFMGPAIG